MMGKKNNNAKTQLDDASAKKKKKRMSGKGRFTLAMFSAVKSNSSAVAQLSQFTNHSD